MKKYINTSNYYLSTTTSVIPNNVTSWTFDVSDVTVDWVTLPLEWYYWVDVDFGDASKREIFRIKNRNWYTLAYDARISPFGMKTHQSWTSVGLRDFSQLLNSLSTNTDNFWEVERTGDLTVSVRGGIVYHTSNMKADTGKIAIEDTDFTFNVSSTTYIVVENDEVLWWVFSQKTDQLLTEEWQYPIAKITTGTSSINEVEDLRALTIGNGNMRSEVYDPQNKRRELYLMDNMEQSVDWQHLFVNQWQVDLRDSYAETKQDKLISWVNIKTINWESILAPGNIPLNTILTVGWHTYVTDDGAETFTFPSDSYPLSTQSFIVFTDSGTMMVAWETGDYIYDEGTHTITFNEPLASSEHAFVRVMYNNSTSEAQIGSAIITLTAGDVVIDEFNVNQQDDQTIDIGVSANNSTITIAQGWLEDQNFTTNQADDSTIKLQWLIDVTQDEYDNLPATKTSDNNWYVIYESEE